MPGAGAGQAPERRSVTVSATAAPAANQAAWPSTDTVSAPGPDQAAAAPCSATPAAATTPSSTRCRRTSNGRDASGSRERPSSAIPSSGTSA
ncbi:hypothetical protein GCM10025872_18500 [Barrientosiimonas endolithica]|uniref:Uncharacterized protein n=1 Tax=Barrientosiimonas endolithica TaxID=1535208 RepID=A0ABN6YRL6_9MICO|nr:hypothetical protein GCM10025872_18500 [Barrientosiimonas endolithica]